MASGRRTESGVRRIIEEVGIKIVP
jgi:hypothetical protein